MIRALIFDLDGTLVNSLPGIAKALNLALADLGFPGHTEEQVVSFIGNGALALAELGLPEDQKDLSEKLLAGFLEHYKSTWQDGTPIFPGVAELVGNLKKEGYPMAVLSNKMHPATKEIVESIFPPNTFEPVYGQRAEKPKKPDPTVALEIISAWGLKPEEVAYVGDSDVDLATARNAGMIPLIFSWGYGTPEGVPLLESCTDLRMALSKK